MGVRSGGRRIGVSPLCVSLAGERAKCPGDASGTVEAACRAARVISVNGKPAEPLLESSEFAVMESGGRAKEKVSVLFAGCGSDFWKRMTRRLRQDGFECSRASSPKELFHAIYGGKVPSVIVLGTEINDWGVTQLMVLDYIKSNHSEVRAIYITDEDNPNCALIIAKGADDIVSKDVLQPKGLVERVEGVLKLHRSGRRASAPPLMICEATQEGVLQADEARLERIKETMDDFAPRYDYHQRETGHYVVMHRIFHSFARCFGRQILDVGCGTGYPMRQLIRDPMVPNFAAWPKEREFTGILGVDMRPVMLLEAQAGYERLMKRHGDILRENLKLRFLEADFLQLDSKMLAGMEFDALDTILASYFIHWASDKEAAVKKFSELLIPGGKLITVEEWPLVVTPSSHMTAEQAERIKRNALPIDPNRYYKMLREHGFREVQGGVLDMEIDVHHRMFGHVFVKE